MPYHLKPNPDRDVNDIALKVLDPVRGDFLPKEGRQVPKNSYWLRRIRKGEVIEFDPEAEKVEEKNDTAGAETAEEAPAEEAPAKTTGKRKAKAATTSKTSENGEKE